MADPSKVTNGLLLESQGQNLNLDALDVPYYVGPAAIEADPHMGGVSRDVVPM
jgi:hypothetical protein